MKINVYYDLKDICQITVIGECEGTDEEIYLLELMMENHDKTMHITFLDANILGNRIVENLYRIQHRKRMKLFVQKTSLFSYLYRLGIQCNYVTGRTTTEQKNEKAWDADPEEIKIFLEEIKKRYGYDYTLYQSDSITRRIKACMLKEGIRDFQWFRTEVLKNEQVFEQLFMYFSVNTTEFFRNPEVYKEIKDRILPYLSSYPYIRIWCAGCSTGQEPYSLAILLDEAGLLKKTQIYATDINPYVIEAAKNGLYPLKGLEYNINNYRSTGANGSFMDYFNVKGEYIETSDKLREKILFFQHSLDGDGILNEFQLILCRNVLIYFSPLLQEKVLKSFAGSLERNGFLVLGKSEGIMNSSGSELFYEFNKRYKVYKKVER